MDLSSLEGPPIHDPRFTIAPANQTAPRIHLDSAPAYQINGRRRPSRPASAEIITFQHGRYYAQEPNRPLPTRRSVNVIPPRSRRRSHSPCANFSLRHPHPQPSNSWRFPCSPGPAREASSFTPNPALAHPRGLRNPGHLIWLDDENMWIVSDNSQRVSSSQNVNPNLCPRPQPYNQRHYQQRQQQHQQRSPIDILPPLDPHQWTEDDDLPPSYESHYFDRVLPVQPLPPPPPPPPPFVTEPDRPAVGNLRVGGDTSRWTAVARRVNRASP